MAHHEYEKMFSTVYHQGNQRRNMASYHVSTRTAETTRQNPTILAGEQTSHSRALLLERRLGKLLWKTGSC